MDDGTLDWPKSWTERELAIRDGWLEFMWRRLLIALACLRGPNKTGAV